VRPEPAVPVFLLLFLASACVRPIAAFTCADSTQCNGGICQPTGLCSFDDASCASGQRYGTASGDAGDVCVEVDPPMCDLARPFGTPDLVAGIQSTTEDGTLRLSVDEKTGYFFSARGASGDKKLLYTATRPAVLGRFDVPVPLTMLNLNTQYHPSITNEGRDLFFATYRNSNDIYQATRASASVSFLAAPQPVTGINSAASEVQPYVTHDGKTIYFVRDEIKVFRATNPDGAGFTGPAEVGEINTSIADADPVPSDDGLTLYWASARPGGAGDLDIWEAHRATTDMPFGDFAPVPNVNSPAIDAPSDISRDGCRLYLTSSRSKRIAIYVAARPPLVAPGR